MLKIAIWSAGGVWLAFGAFAGWILMMGGSAKFAEVGDAFGVVNSLFSSLAVAGAIYAVILQQKELVLTRDEMKQARLAHEQSADAQERMTIIQGHSTILSDLGADIAAARARIDPLKSFLFELIDFERTNPEAFKMLNFPSNLCQTAREYFRRGEAIGVWTVQSYHVEREQMPMDIKKMAASIDAALRKEHEHLSEMLNRKATVAARLYGAMKLPSQAESPATAPKP